MSQQTAIVIGAGVVGLATARALSLKGYHVTVIERNQKAVGASIRNFGMVWPIGQPDGVLYDRAIRSKQIWKEIADSIGIWYDEVGSLHLAYHDDEWIVLQELYESFSANGRPVKLMDSETIMQSFKGINPENLRGGLFSNTEMIIDPREAIAKVPNYLSEYLDVSFIWDTTITEINGKQLKAGNHNYSADLIFVCSGADLETLYPDLFADQPITKCKLQMMRFAPAEKDWRIGTSICGGLSLIHYHSFKAAASLQKLKNRYSTEMEAYLDNGIHVMVSQNESGELTVGDTHEYAHTFDPFDKVYLNNQVLTYLKTFAISADWKLVQSWHGIYPKMTNSATELLLHPEPNVYILNGLGGNGMTLAFGLAEETINDIYL
jgi:FAD dependent oxidoreductase TIGR03364